MKKGEVTIYDIAKELNVSASTVSRALNDHSGINKETKKKIQKVARKLAYQHNTFASNLRKKKTNTIGVILPRFNSYFMSTVVAGMEKEANRNGYNLIISQSQESVSKEESSVNTMFNSRVDGLLVSLAYDTVNLDHFNSFFQKEIPVIFFDRVFELPGSTNIVIDNTRAGYDVTSHLLSQGCQRIAFLAGSLSCHVYAERFKGYKKALREQCMEVDDKLVFINMLNEEAGIETARKILSMKDKPDGIFAANDTSAVATMCHLKEHGVKIPEDIAVVGFNNNPISKVVEPNLSTVDYPGHEMGEIAASTLINKLNNAKTPHLNKIVLQHELIVRESSKRK